MAIGAITARTIRNIIKLNDNLKTPLLYMSKLS